MRADGSFAGGAAPGGQSRRLDRGLPGTLRLLPIDPGVPQATLRSSVVTVGRAEDNDPHREHDFASVELAGKNSTPKFYAKIDYYDRDMRYTVD